MANVVIVLLFQQSVRTAFVYNIKTIFQENKSENKNKIKL